MKDPRSTFEKQKEFLKAWSETFSVARAAEVANVGRASHFRWLRKDAKYAKAFRQRKEEAGNYLEDEAISRAGEGWLEPIYYQGNVCGEVRRFDSGLLQFLLRGMLPQKYGARAEISGPQGAPVQGKIEVTLVRPDGSTDCGNAG